MTTPAYEEKGVLIRLDGVGVSYGDSAVLAGVTAEVRDIVREGCVTGQIIGILGPSGVGKTQLSRVMTGLQPPTAGKVTVAAPTAADPARQVPVTAGLVGYVAQNYPLLGHRTVLGNLVLAARRSGLGHVGALREAERYLKEFRLQDKWDKYPAQLSGGQRQRVAIAQQLLCSEHFLVLDEPTTGLDPISKDKVCELIKQVAGLSEENTIFVVTHDVAAILTIADHLWMLGRPKSDPYREPGSAQDKPAPRPGARIVQTYDLIERGLAWQERPQDLPVYVDLQREIRARFNDL
jgi:polar amino acid transport system ATP-binding protein/sulfate transport system ATP-binding protein